MKYLFALLLFVPIFCSGATLHAILAIDTLSPGLENPMLCNQRQWNRFLQVVAKETGMKLNQINLSGENLTLSEFVQTVASLQVEPDDTLLFYTSSHGIHPPEKNAPWPHLGWFQESSAFDLELVIDLLTAQNARLTFIMADCCNNFDANFEVALSLSKSTTSGITLKNYRKLFLETTGLLITTSASPGEVSFAREGLGSDYTIVFLHTLQQEVKNCAGTDWSEVFKKSANQLLQYDPDQHPIYQMRL